MTCNLYFIIVILSLFSLCLCELSVSQKEKLLNGFIDYYNNLPNQVYTCKKGFLRNTQQLNDTTYQIVADIKVTEISNADVIKTLKCSASVNDLETGVSVTHNVCRESEEWSPETSEAQTTRGELKVEPTIGRKPDQLDNKETSAEQFIVEPLNQPSVPCTGCTSQVNPQAAGVADFKCEVDKALFRTKRQISSEDTVQDPTNPVYTKLAEEALQKYVKDSGTMRPQRVVMVRKVINVVAAGSLTKIEFKVYNNDDSTTLICHTEIMEEFYRHPREMNVSCQNDISLLS